MVRLGSGTVFVKTGGTSPIFNRTDSVSAPYVVSNIISGSIDFTMDFQSGATELKGVEPTTKAKAIVRNGATLILSCAGTDLGAGTVFGGFGATNLIVEAGGVCKLGTPNAAGDHLTAAGRYVYMDGIFDANGSSEAFGILLGNGILDNTGASNAVFTINQGSSDVPNGGIGNGGEVYTLAWSDPEHGRGQAGHHQGRHEHIGLHQRQHLRRRHAGHCGRHAGVGQRQLPSRTARWTSRAGTRAT